MPTEQTRLHKVYEDMEFMEPWNAEAIDNAYKAAIQVLKHEIRIDGSYGFSPANDDRAEQLVAALTNYVMECKR